MKDRVTVGYYWNAVDHTYDSKKNVIMQPERQADYVMFWKRTLLVSTIVTIACLILAPSSCLSAGDAALADVKLVDDLCAYAVLDLAPCADCRVDDYASATRC